MGYRFLDDYDPQKEQKKRQQNGALSAPRSGNSKNTGTPTVKKTTAAPATTPRTTTGTALGGSAATPVQLPAVQVPKLTKTTPVQTTKQTTQPLKLPEIRAFGAVDYSKAGKAMERGAKTVAAGALGAASSAVEMAGQFTPTSGQQSMGQFSGFGDLGRAVQENRRTGVDISANIRQQEAQRREKQQKSQQQIFSAATRLAEKGQQYEAEAKEGMGTVGQFLVDMGVTGTQMAGDALMNLVLPGSGLAIMGLRSYGQAAGEARRAGKSSGQQFLAGLKSAGIEMFTEKMFGAFSKVYGKAGADELVEKLVGKLTKNTTGQALLTWMVNAAGEGVEEVTSDLLNPLADRLLRLDNGKGAIYSMDDLAQWGYDFLLGTAMGVLGGGTQLAQGVRQGQAQTAEADYYADLKRSGLGSTGHAANAQKAGNALGRLLPGNDGVAIQRLQMPTLVDEQGRTYEQRVAWQQIPEAQRPAFDEAQRIAQRFGAQVVVDQREGINGSYRDGVISLNPNAANPVRQTLIHELTHHMESSGMYGKFSDMALRYVAEDMGADVGSMRQAVTADYASRGVTLDEDGATREIVAKFAEEKLFSDEATVRRLLVQDRNLFQRIYDWLRDAVTKLTGTGEENFLRNAEKLYAKALREAGDQTQGGRNTQMLFAGVNAKTANLETLARAEALEANGVAAENIRQETGWFRGMDGKWRFEIDDSGMKYRRDGDARLLEEPEYRRLQDLTEKWASSFENDGTPLTNAETAEMERLQEEYRDRVWDEKYLLRDFVKHDALFEAYPYLNRVSLVFDDLQGGDKGYFDARSNTIVLANDLIGVPENTLVHEIQHVLQKVEGFARGSSPEYWNKRMVEGFSKRWNTGEEMMPTELYRNTAGEIEARDAATRRGYDAEQRRLRMPDLGNENTVFAESGYFSMSANEQAGIREQLRKNLEKLNAMEVVGRVNTLDYAGLDTGKARERLVAELGRRGYTVNRQGFGEIIFEESEINNSLNYKEKNPAAEDARRTGFLVLRDVLKRGIVIDGHDRHKGRNYDTVTIAAPVEINGERANMAVVVKKTKGNRYKVHRILKQEGQTFILPKMANAEMNTVGAFTNNSQSLGGSAPAINSASNASIPKSGRNVNMEKYSTGRGLEEMAADNKLRMPQLTTYEQRIAAEQKAEVDTIDPNEVMPVNGVTDQGKYKYLVSDFQKNGYKGRPIVAYETPYGYQALTGSHRILAAREAGIELPTVLLTDGNVVSAIENVNSDEELAIVAKELYDEGIITEEVKNLLIREDELNTQNYNVPYEKQTRYSTGRGLEEMAADNKLRMPQLTTYEQRMAAEQAAWETAPETPVDEEYLDALARDENVFTSDPYTVADRIYDLKLKRAQQQEAPPERPAEQVAQEDLDELTKLFADQANYISSREDRINETENMVADHTTPEKKTMRQNGREAWSYFYRKMVDAGHSVTKFAKATGDQYLYQFYNQARAASSAGVSMITDAQTNINAQKVGKSLNDIFSPIREKGEEYYRAFQMYLFHLHNIDRMSLSKNKEGAVLEAKEALHDFDSNHPEIRTDTEAQLMRLTESMDPDVAALAAERMRLLRNLNAAEAIKDKPVFSYEVTADESRERARRALQQNPEFDQYRQEVRTYIDNLMQYRVDSGLMTQENADYLKKLYPNYVPTMRAGTQEAGAGRDRNAVRIGKTVGRAEGGTADLVPLHEALGRQTMKVVREGSKNRFGQRLLDDYIRAGDTAETNRYVQEANEYEHEFSPDTLDDMSREQLTKDKILTVYKDGKLWELTVDDTMFDALKALSPDAEESNMVTRTIRAANNLFKSLVTGYNPTFTVRNTLRDLQTAGLYTRDAAAFVRNYPKALAEIKNNGEYWQMYKALGGSFSSVFDYNTGTVKEPKGRTAKLMAKVEALNMAMEQAPRLAEFMGVVEKGGSGTENLADALYAAADVTVNFGRAGTLGKVLNANYVPFLNPGIQGFDKLIRRVTETKGGKEWAKLAIRAAALGVAPALLNSLLYHDDEEWDELRDSDKDTNYMFKLGNGVWLKIPKGRELSLLGITADRITDAIKGEKVDILATLNTMGNQVAPANPLTSNIASALFEAQLFDPSDPGRTWYGGDIENQRMQSYAPGQRYDSSTDIFSKAVGGALGISPKKLNYVLDQYTGVVGDFLLPLLTPQAERGMFEKAFTVDVVSSNRLSGDFYDEADQLTYAKNAGDKTAAVVSRFWSKQQSACSDIYQQIREVEASDLSNSEKKQKTRELKAIVNGIQKNAMAVEETYRAAVEKNLLMGMDADEAYRAANKDCFGAEYALQVYSKDVYERAKNARSNGVTYEDYYTYYFGTKGMESTDDKSVTTQKFEFLQNSGMSLTSQAEIYFADMASDKTLETQAQLEISSGITAEQFYQYKVASSGMTKKAEKMQAINSLDLTSAQKDAIYYAEGWAQSTIGQAPWRSGYGGYSGGSSGKTRGSYLQALAAKNGIDLYGTAGRGTERRSYLQYLAEKKGKPLTEYESGSTLRSSYLRMLEEKWKK